MKTTADYLDMLVDKTGAKSDGACGLMLGWTRAATSNYRNKKNAFDNHACLIVAKRLEIPLEQVIADMELQREKDEKKKADWLSFELRLRGAAATFAAASIVTLIMQEPPANADESRAYDVRILQPTNYANHWERIRTAASTALCKLDTYFRRVCCSDWINACKTA